MRVERDLVGKLSIPSDALYGINTLRAANNLSFSGKALHQYPAFIKALAIVKKAAAKTNKEVGLYTEKIGDAIISSCGDIINGEYHDQFIVDVLHGGGGIGFNMNMNEVLSNLSNEKLGSYRGAYAPVHPVDHVNASQSTSDVCHTAIRLAIILNCQPLTKEMDSIIKVVENKVAEFEHVITITRTCLQDGLRARFGDIFGAYASVLKRRKSKLEHAMEQLYQINLGGTVIGSGIGASQEYKDRILASLCHEANMKLQYRDNLFDSAQNMDDLAQFSSELRLLAACLMKFAKDLRLLSSGPEAGFAEIQLPAVQAGSSFFPGKINPVIPETLIQCSFQVFSCDQVVQSALEQAELDLNIFECAAGINILDAVNMLEKALSNFTENCVAGIKVNEERCQELASSYIPVVVELKERLGYSKVSKLVKHHTKEELKQFLTNGGDKIDTIY